MMRNLLILLAVAAAQVGFYCWFLPPSEIYWWSVNGIVLATVAVVCSSAVLQILWQDNHSKPDSTVAETEPPPLSLRQRTRIAGFFALLALSAMAGLVAWGIYQGPMVYRICSSHQALDLDRLARMDDRLPDLVPPIMERRFEVSTQVMRKCIKSRGDSQSNEPLTWYCAKFSPLVKHDLLGKPKADHTLALIKKIRNGNQQDVQSLIDAGVDLNVPDPNSGLTPLAVATHYGDAAIIELLKQNGAK